MFDFNKLKPEIERVCRAMPVKRLGIFGSALTKEFGAQIKIPIFGILSIKQGLSSMNDETKRSFQNDWD